ncbi:MAG: restriction endonuclease subunit S [Pseudanabaena sp.]
MSNFLESLENIPDQWLWTTTGQIAEITGGLTKNQNRAKCEKQVPYLRVANVYANELRLDDISEIGISETEWNRVKLKKDDLLIVEGNGSIEHIGRVALWDGSIDPCVHQNHLIKMRLGSLVLSKYALYWLLSPSGRNVIMQVASSSSGLHTLSISKVSSLPIPLCQIEEQKEIVRRVEKMFAKIDKMEEEYQKAVKLCDRLEQATLAKAFRGELVPQDPNDEPASVLLEQVKREKEKGKKGVKSK